jgi:limonene-1,2-epoxide hydrolase
MDAERVVARRRFLKAAGSTTAAVVALAGTVDAEWTSAEKVNVQVVNEFCASFAGRDVAKIASFLADNCVYRVTETAMPLVGKDAVVARIKGFVDPAQVVEFPVAETFAKGPIVMNERTDRFVRPDRTNTFHVVGVFFVRDGKIAEWTDYIIRG